MAPASDRSRWRTRHAADRSDRILPASSLNLKIVFTTSTKGIRRRGRRWMKLTQLACGESATVARISGSGAFRRRLLELGLVPGTPVTKTARAGSTALVAYECRGVVLCLRADEAETVEVAQTDERLAAK
jgi:ferrous iron transport protein A